MGLPKKKKRKHSSLPSPITPKDQKITRVEGSAEDKFFSQEKGEDKTKELSLSLIDRQTEELGRKQQEATKASTAPQERKQSRGGKNIMRFFPRWIIALWEDWRRVGFSQKITIVINAITCAAIIVYAAFALAQARAIKQQTELSSRAWVAVNQISNSKVSNATDVFVQLANSGHSVATGYYCLWYHKATKDDPAPAIIRGYISNAPAEFRSRGGHSFVMAPGQTGTTQVKIPLTEQELKAIQTGEMTLCILGGIQYKDVLSDKRWTTLGYYYDAPHEDWHQDDQNNGTDKQGQEYGF